MRIFFLRSQSLSFRAGIGMALLIALTPRQSLAQDAAADLEIDITHLSIEDLTKLNVTTASKTEEKVIAAPAAIYVLSGESIRRSGVTSIPEALRLVPGVQVVRTDANKYIVTSRGFLGSADKILVLIDGRVVYDLLFSGVLWESKDVMLEDLDRIEVIRGPGGTLWGANAVNGVINIITKKASETRGNLLSAGGGTEERLFGAARSGFALSESSDMRLYARYRNRDSGEIEGGADDDSQYGLAGFRLDDRISPDSHLTVQGDAFQAQSGSIDNDVLPDEETSGFNLLTHWNKSFSAAEEFSALLYYDHSEINNPALGEIRNTMNLEAQQSMEPLDGHRLIGGAGFRLTSDHERESTLLGIDRIERTDLTYSLFLEDRISLVADTLFLTLGSKVEWNEYTNFEYQPTGRLAWEIDPQNTLWLAVSRAVRVPSRLESDLLFPAENPIVRGNPDQESEDLLAYELGYRAQLTDTFSLDLASFYNIYNRLITFEQTTIGNKSDGESYGGEAAVSWRLDRTFALSAGYAYLNMNLALDEDSLDDPATRAWGIERSDPKNGAFLRAEWDLGRDWQLDMTWRYVDSLPGVDVPSYLVGDVRVGYRVMEGLDLTVTGQNLFDGDHIEYQQPTSEVQPGVYGKLTWRF